MRTIDYHGNTICVLENDEMLTECPNGAYAVFEDVGGWLAVKVYPGIAIPLHTDLFQHWKTHWTKSPGARLRAIVSFCVSSSLALFGSASTSVNAFWNKGLSISVNTD